MNYIKSFNESNYYTKVSDWRETNRLSELIYDVSDKLLSFIKKIKLEHDYIYVHSNKEFIRLIDTRNPLEKTRYVINELEDEWYFVDIMTLNDKDNFKFKCDQIDGLEKLLQDFKLI